jgi:DNA-binding transcriptional ArsR family regulator
MADEASQLLKALSHPGRLVICSRLKDGEMSVGEMEQELGIRQPRLSRELAKLREEGLVETRRESKMIFYRLSENGRLRAMVEAICFVMLSAPGGSDRKAISSPAHRAQPAAGYGIFARPVSEI